MYNLTALYNAETVPDLFSYANSSVGGMLMGLLMMAVFFVLLLTLKKWPFPEAFLASSWISFILSMFLVAGGMLTPWFAFAFLIAAALMTFYMFVKGDN